MSMSISEQQLRSAREMLATRTENKAQLGGALLELHSALENRLRELLAATMPDQRDEILDANTTEWKALLEYSQSHLGLLEDDARYISKMNYQRNLYAHAKAYREDYIVNYDLVRNYLDLVDRLWRTGSRDTASASHRPRSQTSESETFSGQSKARQRTGERPRSYAQSAPRTNSASTSRTDYRTSNVAEPIRINIPAYYSIPEPKPWYRTSIFYWFTFIFFTPIWAIVIFTDKNQGWPIKLFAVIILMVILFLLCMFVFVFYVGMGQTQLSSIAVHFAT